LSEYSESVTVASNYIQTVFGQFDANIKKIEKEYSVSMILRDDKLKVSGSEEGVKKSIQVIEQLFQMADRGSSIDEQKVDYTISIVNEHPQEAKESLAELDRDIICHTMSGKPIKPKTVGQRTYVNSIEKSMIVFGVGPAGTGKTYLAMAKAITAFKNNEVGRIILTRPAIEAGEKLGFLPGDLQSKVDPYLRPLYDALYEIMGADL
jgi:phosphate starvation-inducible PhoH-like protein